MLDSKDALKDIINSFVYNLNDKEIASLKKYSPQVINLITNMINKYMDTLSENEKKIERPFLKSFINKLI